MSSTQQLLLTEGGGATPNYIEDVFSTYLYTGNGSTQTITNNIDLSTKGGLVWTKKRNGVASHALFDTARGTNSLLSTDSTASAASQAQGVTAFGTTGYSLGTYSLLNQSGYYNVSWTFREQPKFFDVVTYTGNGSSTQTISHNLGTTPGCIIVKKTSGVSNWSVYHRSLTAGSYIKLNTQDPQVADSFMDGANAPTSTTFTAQLATSDGLNANGATYVAYLFAHDAGGFGLAGTDNVISCGSYTGNGTDSNTVTLGYEPQLVMVKTAIGGNAPWVMLDIMRGFTVNYGNRMLVANTSEAESSLNNSYSQVEPIATGFKLTSDGTETNVSGRTYIYIAIRRGPMKVPTDATKVFNSLLLTGNGANRTVTGVGFPTDLFHSKARNSTFANSFYDRLRGKTRELVPNSTAIENTDATSLTGFDLQDGVYLGTDSVGNATVNYPGGYNYVEHYFRRAPSFFDEVCYSGTGANRTVTHNLGVAPELMIVKRRDAIETWAVYSQALGATKYLYLNTTAAAMTSSTRWNDTSPTSSVFTVSTSSEVNNSAGTYVAYLFATCPGVSKVGSYTGNGTTQTINCGFAGGARFVLIKRTDSTGDWYVYDTARGMSTLTDPYLLLNSTAAEAATLGSVTTVTTGFAVNASILAAINTNGASYIYLSIA